MNTILRATRVLPALSLALSLVSLDAYAFPGCLTTFEETYPTFRRIRTLRNDIAMRARQAFIAEPTLTKLETARVLLEQLAPYYEAEETGQAEQAD